MSARKDRTGETSVATNGMTMTVVAYRGCYDIDVQFEDGSIRKGIRYSDFKNGQVGRTSKQKYNTDSNKSRIGETAVANNGQTMTIIKYTNYENIVVEFDDDNNTQVKTRYSEFKKGKVRNPNFYNTRIGETSITNNGTTMTIIEYINYENVIVEFDDEQHTRVKTTYSHFKKGTVRKRTIVKKTLPRNPAKKSRIGEVSNTKNGIGIKIVEYIDCKHIVVEFEDEFHTRVKTDYRNFKKGTIRNPNYRIGEVSKTCIGMIAKIVKYIRSDNIIVEYDDKCHTRVKTTYSHFNKGKVQNPHFPMRGKGTYGTFETQYAYTAPNGSVYFYCECQKCGWKKNLTARELINLNHTCENIEGSEK